MSVKGPHESDDAAPQGAVLELDVSRSPLESVELLDGGERAYPAMLSAIEGSKKSIDLQVYAFSSSGVGARFVEALTRASRRGVAVRVVIDGWGSARKGRFVAASLREAGCRVRIYNRLLAILSGRFGRNHRKLLLVDDQVAFLGGINIGDENLPEGLRPGWADLALAIRGPQCGRLAAMIRRQPLGPVTGALQIHLCGAGGGWRLRRRYLEAIANAQSSIYLAHGYFIPDRGILRAITNAARRGVRVQLLLAGRSDVLFARTASRSLHRRLLNAGVGIHEWTESVLLAKVATIDGHRLLLGSFNLDPFSLANLETLVEVDGSAPVVEQAEAWIRERMDRSVAMTSLAAASPVRRWLFDPFGRLVARVADGMGRVIASRKRRRSSKDLAAPTEAPASGVDETAPRTRSGR